MHLLFYGVSSQNFWEPLVNLSWFEIMNFISNTSRLLCTLDKKKRLKKKWTTTMCLVPVSLFLNVKYNVLLSCVAHVYMYCKHIFQCKHVIYRFPSPQTSGFVQQCGGIWRTQILLILTNVMLMNNIKKKFCVLCKFQARTGFLLMVAKLTRVSSSQYLLQIYTHKISVLE